MAADHLPDHLNTAQGLTTTQARTRLAQDGLNEAAIEALRQLTQAQARVLRDGPIQEISANEVVVGDGLL